MRDLLRGRQPEGHPHRQGRQGAQGGGHQGARPHGGLLRQEGLPRDARQGEQELAQRRGRPRRLRLLVTRLGFGFTYVSMCLLFKKIETLGEWVEHSNEIKFN